MRIGILLGLLAIAAFVGQAAAGVIVPSTEVFPNDAPSWGSVPHGDASGWSTAKASWGKVACTFGGNSDVPSRTNDGSKVLRMKFTTGQGSAVAAIQFASTPGVAYTLDGYVQENVTGGWTEFQLVDGADWSGWDSSGFCDVLSVPSANTWVNFGKTVVATGSTMSIVMKAGTNTSAYTLVFWDDITITPEPMTAILFLPVLALVLRRRRT